MEDLLKDISEEKILEIYDDIIETNLLAGCTYGACHCYTKNGYSVCSYRGCGSGSDWGWYYAWQYYVSCNNGVTGSGYWNGGECSNAVCRWVQ